MEEERKRGEERGEVKELRGRILREDRRREEEVGERRGEEEERSRGRESKRVLTPNLAAMMEKKNKGKEERRKRSKG